MYRGLSSQKGGDDSMEMEERMRVRKARIGEGESARRKALKGNRSKFEEQRMAEIERENRVLLEKMSSIVQSRQPRSKTLPKKSLNVAVRRRELVRITLENHAFLRRLQGKHPLYTLTLERRKKRTARRDSGELEARSEDGDRDRRGLGRGEESRWRNKSEYLATVPEAIKHRPSPHSKPQLVFKQTVKINRRLFLIEIYLHRAYMKISAFDIESPHTYKLRLTLKEAENLVGGSSDYEKIVDMLAFEEGEMMLVERRHRTEPIGLPKLRGRLGASRSLNRSLDKERKPLPLRFRTPHPRATSPALSDLYIKKEPRKERQRSGQRGRPPLLQSHSEEPLSRRRSHKLLISDFPPESFLPSVRSSLRSRKRPLKPQHLPDAPCDEKTTEEVRVREGAEPPSEDDATRDRRR